MKIIHKSYIIFIIIMFTLFIGCNKTSKDIVFSLEETEVDLYVGEKYEPIIKVENIKNYQLEFYCDSDAITIKDGIIECLEEDDCEVYISIKDYPDIEPLILSLYITELKPKKIICDKKITVYIDKTYQLNVTVEPSEAPSDVLYSSSNENIVTVSNTGLVQAIKEGKTSIIIQSKDYNTVKALVEVTVEKQPVEKIESVESLSLTYDQTYQLEWKVLPEQSEQGVTFISDDELIASVDNNGLITAHKYGSTIIKILSTKDKTKFFEVKVSVDGDKATDIIIEDEIINLQLGEEYIINYKVMPISAYQGVNIITEDDSSIGVIDDRTIVCKKKGSYQIVLKTIDNTNINKTITINMEGEESPIFVTNSTFDKQSILSWNEEFDIKNNIKAYDDNDGDITDKIKITGTIDNKKYGEYMLEYYIEDSDGNSQKLIRTINVTWGYNTTVIGHAGSYYGVPNSEEAILYAAEVLHYPAIEIDLKQTKDGVFVLSHDPKWGGVSLSETNYEDIKDVKETVTKNEGIVESGLTEEQRTYTSTICTFERYLEICKQYNITAVIELKTSSGISNWTESNAPQSSRMKNIMELIEKYDMLKKVVFLSDQELCLNWVKTNGYEYIPCQYLTLKSCENEETYNIVKKYNLDISFNVRDGIKISDEWLNKYRNLGCKLAVFTFEEYASYSDIQTWIDKGVDYVTTDWHVLDKLKLN